MVNGFHSKVKVSLSIISTSKEIIWEMLTSLEMYNVWFYGIQRALPEVDSDRFVHKYSFSKLELSRCLLQNKTILLLLVSMPCYDL